MTEPAQTRVAACAGCTRTFTAERPTDQLCSRCAAALDAAAQSSNGNGSNGNGPSPGPPRRAFVTVVR